jgi:hypothetical protein
MRKALAVAAVVLSLVLLAGCGSRPMGEPPVSAPSPTQVIEHSNGYSDGPQSPGSFVVRFGDTELHLDPTTYCYNNGCVDGMDPDPPEIGAHDEILVFVPVREFTELSASQRSGDDYCTARQLAAETTDLGEGWWRVTPQGPAGDYIVSLFAGGNGSGDMIADLRWTTPDAPLPPATASLALIVDHDGVPDSYGLELAINGLTDSPAEYAASIVVTADNGEAMTIEATAPTDCFGEGALYFDGPDNEATDAASLGDFPFEYEVTLALDGDDYVATATYPDDLIEDDGVAVALEFEPALP